MTVLVGPEREPRPKRANPCCGDPKNLDGGAHPWRWSHYSPDQKADVYVCADLCGAVDVE